MHSYSVYNLYDTVVVLRKLVNMVCRGSLRLLHTRKNILLLVSMHCTGL